MKTNVELKAGTTNDTINPPTLANDKKIEQKPFHKKFKRDKTENIGKFKGKKHLRILRTNELETQTKVPVENGEMQQLPVKKAVSTNVPRKTIQHYKNNKLFGGHDISKRPRRKRIRKNP